MQLNIAVDLFFKVVAFVSIGWIMLNRNMIKMKESFHVLAIFFKIGIKKYSVLQFIFCKNNNNINNRNHELQHMNRMLH